MKKKNAIILILLLSCIPLFARTNSRGEPSMDGELRWSLPTVRGIVCGKNSAFGLQKPNPSFNKCIRFNDEARMIFPQDGEVNPFFTFGCHGFVWLTEGDAEGTMGVSLGGGIFYNLKGFFGKTSFDGINLTLYPMYEFYLDYKLNDDKWKSAAEIGINRLIFKRTCLSLFCRVIAGINDNGFHCTADCGMGIGLFFPDRF